MRYNDAVKALHALGRSLEGLSDAYARAANTDAAAYELKREALRSMLATMAREERAAADGLDARGKNNLRQLKKAAND